MDQDEAGLVETGDGFGEVVATGDFDCDGCDDLAVGAPNQDFVATDEGALHVLWGRWYGL